ncbi:MAG TPA: WYL domain-containing protein [Lachnospiraceae bacterium]|nr:WYL domain-containing protein [Lachnospiraceae bacterium]
MRLQRLLMIIFYLKMHNFATTAELSEYLEVSKRTISRDIEILRTAGVTIESTTGKNGGYLLAEDFSFDSIIFSKSELSSMLLGTQFLYQFKNTEFAREAELLSDKISKLLEGNKEPDIKAREFLLIDTETNPRAEYNINAILQQIENAYDSRKLLFIDYKSMMCHKFSTSGLVAPYGLVNKSGFWYLAGYCYEHQAYRVFNIAFIQNIYITQDSFERDRTFHLDAFWETQKY